MFTKSKVIALNVGPATAYVPSDVATAIDRWIAAGWPDETHPEDYRPHLARLVTGNPWRRICGGCGHAEHVGTCSVDAEDDAGERCGCGVRS